LDLRQDDQPPHSAIFQCGGTGKRMNSAAANDCPLPILHASLPRS
jgi:hypothetical protein